jgi:hypothetical protein
VSRVVAKAGRFFPRHLQEARLFGIASES